jgi:uncharacterized protein (DUF983 family)
MAGEPFYPEQSAVSAGLKGACPRCGRGRLFSGYLSVAERCPNCGLAFDFSDAGDGAPWFVMLIAGFLAVGAALFVEIGWQPSYWVHAAVAVPLAVGVPLLLLRPIKGMLICQQYKTNAAPGRATGPSGD